MANKIPLYETGKLSIDPSATGEAAFQQAGRRIGPAYNEAATLTRSIAEAQATVIKQRKWPFDMLELERSLETTGGRLGGSADFIGTKLQGGINNLVNDNSDGGRAARAARPAHENAHGADVGAHALSAAALGRIAAGMAARGGPEHNSVIDPLTGRDISAKNGRGSEGVSVIDPRTGMDITKLPQSKYDTVLDHGVMRKIDRETGKEVGAAQGPFSGPNAGADEGANSYGRSEQNGAFDPSTDQGRRNIAKFTADNGYDPNSGRFNSPFTDTGSQDDPGENRNPLGPGAPPIPPSRDAGPWWAPDTDELRRQLLPGGDSGDVTEGRDDENIYGRDVSSQSNGSSGGSSDFGNSDSADYGGGSDAET